MESSRNWRLAAKVVACVYLLFCTLALMLVGATILIAAYEWITQAFEGITTTAIEKGYKEFYSWRTQEFQWLMGLSVACICITQWACIGLLRAVTLGTQRSVAVHKARIWRDVSILFFIVGSVVTICGPGWFNAVALVLSAISIFIVWKFIAVFEKVIPSSQEREEEEQAAVTENDANANNANANGANADDANANDANTNDAYANNGEENIENIQI